MPVCLLFVVGSKVIARTYVPCPSDLLLARLFQSSKPV